MNSSHTNACTHLYVNQNDSAVILAANRSAGASPEVNIRNPLNTGIKSCDGGILKPRAGITRIPCRGSELYSKVLYGCGKKPYTKAINLANNYMETNASLMHYHFPTSL